MALALLRGCLWLRGPVLQVVVRVVRVLQVVRVLREARQPRAADEKVVDVAAASADLAAA